MPGAAARRLLGITLWLLGAHAPARAGEFDLLGVLAGRGLVVQGREAWLQGGYGRLTEGAGGAGQDASAVRGALHLGFDWRPGPTWLVHAHGVAQGEPSSSHGQRAGLVEAFVQFRPELTPRDAFRFRAGLFFPPTSLENTDPLWQSPYTLTLSALNTWLGEEARLGGLEAAWVRTGDRDRLELAATVFGANDPSGALLAWRGWGMGERLTTVGEVLPLPPLTSLQPGGAFAGQRDDGSRPIDELDGRPGYQLRARFSRPEAFRVQASWYDNRADRRLYRGQYAWETRFAQAGMEAGFGPGFVLLLEGAMGDSGMGPAVSGGPQVQLRFRTGYALLSWSGGAWRLSARVDAFDNDDRDGTAEPDQETGRAVTAAAFWQPRSFLRVGLEYLELWSSRPAAAFSGADPNTDARRLQGEVRLRF